MKKTGLYAYRTRKLSVVRCDGTMESLLGTMDRLAGVGEAKKATKTNG